ncbi:MAG: Dolichyl-phosphate-mannose-protein mannosyltransferase [Candidatus Parcubacteria bacterium]|jgi:4-amino-4-deoxy-L-arabinose transferase-like glycosyltransferase
MLKTQHKKIIAFIAVIFILFLWFGGINKSDLYSDNALNSFRAYGWFDRLLGGQQAPIDWLGHIPSWALLSFHDAPPVAFMLQNISFTFFGGSPFGARAPFVFAGLISVLALCIAVKRIVGTEKAIWAACLLAINSYAVWAGLAGYLEGIEQLFIITSLFALYFLTTNEDAKPHWLYIGAASSALACMTKYTAIFIFLPALFALIRYRKNVLGSFRTKEWSIALSIFIVIILPVVIYNIAMYQERGHFDAALSSIVGMHPADFSAISSRGIDFNPLKNISSTFSSFAENNSFGFSLLSALSVLWIIYKCIRRTSDRFEEHTLSFFLSFLLMSAFFSGGTRFDSVLTPIIAILTALAVCDWKNRTRESKRYILVGTIVLICVFEAFYAINTNILVKPIGVHGVFYSKSKLSDYGFNELDSYLRKNVITRLPLKKSIRSPKDLNFTNKDVAGRSVVIYDDRINWFAQNWYFLRYINYHAVPILSDVYFDPTQGGVNLIDLVAISRKDLYVISPISKEVLDTKRIIPAGQIDLVDKFVEALEEEKIQGDIIKNLAGKEMFKVYRVPSERLLKVQ